MAFPDRLKQNLRNGWMYLVIFFRHITVEPAVLMFGLGSIIAGITTITILYQKICHTDYRGRSDINCLDLSADPAVQDHVQQTASTWSLAFDGVSTFISIPAILLWSAWADRKKDRIAAIMIPLTGYVIPFYVYVLEDRIAAMPLWIMVLAQGLTSGLGGMALLMGSLNAFLADRFVDKKWLAIRFTIITACIQLSAVIGSEIAGVLIKYGVETAWIIIIGLALMTLGQLYFGTVLTNPAEMWKKKKKARLERLEEKSINNADKPKSDILTPAPLVERQRSIFLTTFDLLKDTYKTFTRPRPQQKRTYILLIVLAAFLAGVSDDGTRSSQNLFLYRRPLNFTFEDFSTYSGGSAGMGLVGTVATATVTKWLGWADTSMAILSLVFNIASNLIFGFSKTKLMVWMSALVNSIGFLWMSALNSAIIKLGEPGEQATLIAGTAVANSLANFLSSLMFNAVYAETEAKSPWVAWVIASALIVIGLICVLVVHVGLKLQGISIDERQFVEDHDCEQKVDPPISTIDHSEKSHNSNIEDISSIDSKSDH